MRVSYLVQTVYPSVIKKRDKVDAGKILTEIKSCVYGDNFTVSKNLFRSTVGSIF